MNATANPAVQMQDMSISSDGRVNTVPGPTWDELKQTVSKLTARSKTKNDADDKIYATGTLTQKSPLESLNPSVTPFQPDQSRDGADAEMGNLVDREDEFPEGGLRAWLVVASAWLLLFPSFGLMVSIGTLQDYWGRHQLSHMSARDIGWIPSIFVYLSLALGIWVGPLFDIYGPRWIALTGSVLFTIMIFLLAECTTFWQMILCNGFLGGTAAAMLTTTSLAAVAHWFKERRGLTQGIAMMGGTS